MTTHPPLGRSQATRALEAVAAELGPSDRERLSSLLPLIGGDGRFRLSAALERLFRE